MYHLGIRVPDVELRQRVARRLRALRVAHVLTQADLAELSGVGRATIARIELGTVTPHPRTIRALAAALDAVPASFVEDESPLLF